MFQKDNRKTDSAAAAEGEGPARGGAGNRGQRPNMDMLHGSLWDKILLYALPMAATSCLQQLFNSADVAVVGRFAGSTALAAVGANAPVINLMINLFVGLSVGANVVIAGYIGQGDDARVSRAEHTTVLLSVICGLLLAVVGNLIARPILLLISTPESILDLAVLYLRIIFGGMPFTMLYNFTASIFRSRGDTRHPLIVLAFAGILNVVLNLFFVIVCGRSVDGVAIATVISNGVSACILLRMLAKEDGPMRLEAKKLRIDRNMLVRIMRIGIPAGLQGCMFSISNVIIQSALNSLGENVVAGSTVALNLEYFVFFMLNAFGSAGVTFIGQNYGAGDVARCRRTLRWCLLLGEAFAMTLALTFRFLPGVFAGIYTSDAAVIETAKIRMSIILPFEFLNGAEEIISGGLRGFGHSFVPALTCMVGVCGVRLLAVFFLFPTHQSFDFLCTLFPVSWAITVTILITVYFVTVKRIRPLSA